MPTPPTDDYALLDSGNFRKLERFGDIVLARPCAQAVWRPSLAERAWQDATASFSREGQNRWVGRSRLPEQWEISVEGIRFQLRSTDFGHLGIFPEQRKQWMRIREFCASFLATHGRPARVINLFAYSGGSTLAAALGAAEVCHVDASKGMVDWARNNAALNGCADKPIRWIVDDIFKFLEREQRRARLYDLVLLDPPTYGRGAKGEVFKIEEALPELLRIIHGVMSERATAILLSCHTPEYTATALANLLAQEFGGSGKLESGEMLLEGVRTLAIPSGTFAYWAAGETAR
jgi:23S rRNA (cytosine1962-C5)-methyltransferase